MRYTTASFILQNSKDASLFSCKIFKNQFLNYWTGYYTKSYILRRGIKVYRTAVPLRPYQKECIDICLHKFLNEKVNRQIVSLPVGSGKTVIFSNLIRRIPPPHLGADKVLVLAHREELIDQAYNQIKRVSSDLTLEIDQGLRSATGNADVIVASVQSLGRLDTGRIDKYNPKNFKAIIIDEAHHAPATTYRRVLEHFGANQKDTHILVWGCSATVRRYDGLALEGIFDEITYHKDFLEMIKEKWLCNLRVTTIKTDIDLSDVKSHNKDFVIKDLSKFLNVKMRNEMIVRTYLALAENRKSTLVFGADIEHVEALKDTFQKFGIEAHAITSKTKTHIRTEILNDFKAHQFPVLINCGTDIPSIDCVVMSRPTKSPVLFQQMIGRGMRLSKGKEDCLVLDFIDSYTKFPDLATVPSLLGFDPDAEMKDEKIGINQDEDLSEHLIMDSMASVNDLMPVANIPTMDGLTSITDLTPEADMSEQTSLVAKSLYDSYELPEEKVKVKITEYSNPFEIIEDCSGATYMNCVSDLAWIRLGMDSYALSLPTYGTLRMEKDDDGIYRVTLRKKVIKTTKSKRPGVSFYLRELPIKHDSLTSVIRACDQWVSRQEKYVERLALRDAPWRKRPIGAGQTKYLKKKAPMMDNETIKSLNKGQAANLMTKIMEGAGKNWKDTLKRKKAEEKKIKKLEANKVRVGPLTDHFKFDSKYQINQQKNEEHYNSMDPLHETVKEIRWNVLEGFSKVARLSRDTAASILEHPLARPILPILPPAINNLIQSEPARSVVDEYDAGRVYLAKWAFQIDRASENDWSESGFKPWEEETEVGAFEFLEDETKLAPLRATRSDPLNAEKWFSFFDVEGRLKVEKIEVQEAVFRGGIENDIRIEVWKFFLGIYPWDSSQIERDNLYESKAQQYWSFKREWFDSVEVQNTDEFKEQKIRIEKDVIRTDRSMEFFAIEDMPHPDPLSSASSTLTNKNLELMKDILMTYNFYNKDLGYVQGMSDLLAPAFVVMRDEVSTFWAFSGFMDRMKTESLNLFFCFRWILIWFKREFKFDEVLHLWEVLWSNYLCTQFHLFVALAILNKHRRVIIENLCQFDEILKYINDLSMTIPVDETLLRAETLFHQFKRTVEAIDRKRGITLQDSNNSNQNHDGLRRRKGKEMIDTNDSNDNESSTTSTTSSTSTDRLPIIIVLDSKCRCESAIFVQSNSLSITTFKEDSLSKKCGNILM
ncbi:5938_t:CDS:10 [Diversispora eburnea]|uniref:5938_t:CDS:1 n=1 Tax=Diversispora eburnea TaxID=1213867 RepID=A0A9N8W730_9GLOM|nr:5938_t:CDS:10 [Diversispora eburnea]